jgi:hypothetical protein
VSRIDEGADTLGLEIGGQTFDAAETTDALRDRRPGGIGRRAGKRQDRRNIGLTGDPPCERARFRRAAENEQTKAVQ